MSSPTVRGERDR